jgi:hypothetical protein
MSNLPYITLHASQIADIAASIKTTGDDLAVRVNASPEVRAAAIKALKVAGIGLPASGSFTLPELNTALDTAFPRSNTVGIGKRMELKEAVYAGGLVLEKSTTAVDKKALVLCGLMARKGGFPLPDGKPYSIADFADVLAAASPAISIEHRMEIKSAFSRAGLLQGGTIEPKQHIPPIKAARQLCDTLGLQVPGNGMKLSTGIVNERMERLDWNIERRLNAKIVLQSGGLL